jgi:transcriptional regulator with XRE-family HTH domain
MDLDSIKNLIARLRRGKAEREKFVESHVTKGIAHQIRVLRETFQMSQTDLASKVGMNQNAISRLESAEYGKPTITTLKRLAAAFDVGLVVRFVPFSEMVNWVTGTAYVNYGLSTQSLIVPSFTVEEKNKHFDGIIPNALLLESVLGEIKKRELLKAESAAEGLKEGEKSLNQGAFSQAGQTIHMPEGYLKAFGGSDESSRNPARQNAGLC